MVHYCTFSKRIRRGLPDQSCPSPSAKMLSEIGIELAECKCSKPSPPTSHRWVFSCTFAHQLHGHGWRQRYYITESPFHPQLWIHRKLCPCCRKTYTLLPCGSKPSSCSPGDQPPHPAYRSRKGTSTPLAIRSTAAQM